MAKYLKDLVFSSLIDHKNILEPIDESDNKGQQIHIYEKVIAGGTLAERIRASLGIDNTDSSMTKYQKVNLKEWPPGRIQYNEV